ncbi:MAG: hypothetical protein KZQ58_01410 [gamma proteobacterium symbiont of Bathyaustriella thionipta]|nr:hypothetical protein [gamma proteobacterium symbiont of Bathyaustriella thionipta]
MMKHEQELDRLRTAIAATFSEREALKQQLERGSVSPAMGLYQLEKIDAKLSELDSRFKQLWDRSNRSGYPPT